MPRVATTPLRALLVATRLLGHALDRAVDDATCRAQTVAELRLICGELAQQNAVLRALHGWSLDDTAAHALVTPATVARRERDAHATTPDAAATPARPRPPVRRFADVVRQLIQTMDRAGMGGNALIARTLARAG